VRIRALDFETTGIPSEDDPHAVCEIGFVDIDVATATEGRNEPLCTIGETIAFLVNPGRAMPAEARAVHHISDEDIFAGAEQMSHGFLRLANPRPDFFAAHHATFEQKFFGNEETVWLDTYKIALRIYQDAPSHSLQVLRYWLDLDVDFERGMPPHRAGPDAYVCAVLLARMIEENRASIEDMARWSKGHALWVRMQFGQHDGRKMSEVPSSYYQWMLKQKDMDPEKRANAKHQLKLRGELN
jgi:exodeoxyribonuclease X